MPNTEPAIDSQAAAEFVHLQAQRAGKKAGGAGSKTADTRALEKRIEEALGLKASLSLKGSGETTLLTLEIRDFEQLDAVVERLTRR